MGKGGENNSAQPSRKITLDELSQHRTPDNGIINHTIYILYINLLLIIIHIYSMVII